MKVYTYGNQDHPVIMLLCGGLMHHSFYDVAVSFLTKEYYCIVISYDGFDDEEEGLFVSFEQEASQIEDYLQTHHDGHITAVYGTMSGGLLATLIMVRRHVAVDHVILGSTMFFERSIDSALQKRKEIRAWKKAKASDARTRFKAYEHDHMYYQGLLRYYAHDLSYISDQTIINYLTSCCQLRFPSAMSSASHVHIFFATKMGFSCLQSYMTHFQELHIAFHPFREEEYLIAYPYRWYLAVRECINGLEPKNPFWD